MHFIELMFKKSYFELAWEPVGQWQLGHPPRRHQAADRYPTDFPRFSLLSIRLLPMTTNKQIDRRTDVSHRNNGFNNGTRFSINRNSIHSLPNKQPFLFSSTSQHEPSFQFSFLPFLLSVRFIYSDLFPFSAPHFPRARQIKRMLTKLELNSCGMDRRTGWPSEAN
jgi:hypothetical protein